jgi:regulator of sigma E protease
MVTLQMPKDFKTRFLASKTPFADVSATQVQSVVEGSNAEKAGLQAGDRIFSVNGKPAVAFAVFSLQLARHKASEVELGVVRGQDSLYIPAQVDAAGKLGFLPSRVQVGANDRYGFFRSIPVGFQLGIRKLAFYVLQLKLIFNKEGIGNVGGFGAIGNLFPPVWDWFSFWMTTALLSIMLGVMNLLPIPALDGGHVLFLLYEVVSRRKPSDKFLISTQVVGMTLLISLLVYANGMDLVRAFFK